MEEVSISQQCLVYQELKSLLPIISQHHTANRPLGERHAIIQCKFCCTKMLCFLLANNAEELLIADIVDFYLKTSAKLFCPQIEFVDLFCLVSLVNTGAIRHANYSRYAMIKVTQHLQ